MQGPRGYVRRNMRPRALRPLEKGLAAYVIVLVLLLTLTFGVNALVAAQPPRALSPPNTTLSLPTLIPAPSATGSPASP